LLLPVLHDVREGELLVVVQVLEHEELGVEVDERVEQNLGAVRTQLLGLPQVLLLDTSHKVTELVDRKFKVLELKIELKIPNIRGSDSN
jgi:hypothetical protein